MFKATITDAFELSTKEGYLVLMLNHVEGDPEIGDHIQINDLSGTVIEVGEPGIRDRACLTGRHVPRHGGILVDIGTTEITGLYKSEITGGIEPDAL